MANFRIITNNPLAAEKYPALAACLDVSVAEIFTVARDAVHKGAVLINHPLSGSVKPNESPYKSLMLSDEKENLDVYSLQLIEGAQEVLMKLPQKKRVYSARILEDFMVIDLDLLDSAVSALPPAFHM